MDLSTQMPLSLVSAVVGVLCTVIVFLYKENSRLNTEAKKSADDKLDRVLAESNKTRELAISAMKNEEFKKDVKGHFEQTTEFRKTMDESLTSLNEAVKKLINKTD